MRRSFFVGIFIFFLLFLVSGDITFAAEEEFELKSNEEEVIDIHQKMDSVLHVDQGMFIGDFIRWIGWGFISLTVWIVDYIEDGVNGVLALNNFYDSFGVNELVKQVTPFVMGLFFLALLYLGFQFMFNKIDKREEVLMNVLMAFGFIFLVPALMPYMGDVLKVGLNELKGEEQQHLTSTVIKMNVADVGYYVDSNFNFEQLGLPLDKKTEKGQVVGTSNYSNANKLAGTNLQITEKLEVQGEKGWFLWKGNDYGEYLAKNNPLAYDVLRTQLVYTGDGSKVSLKPLATNVVPNTKIGLESYYRYHVNWGTIIFSLIVIGIALAITVIKIARIIFDLAFHSIFVMGVSATDLTGGQRTKKVVTEIISSFAVLFIMMLILKLFTMYVNWVVGLTPIVGSVISVLMLVAGAWALIDAPDIVSRVLGIDAGLRSGYQALMGAYAGTKLAGAAGKGLMKGVGATAKGVGGAKSFAQGLRGKQTSSGGNGQRGKGGIAAIPSGTGGSPRDDGPGDGGIPSSNSSIPSGSSNSSNSSVAAIPSSGASSKPGIYSGSRRGQEMADIKARSFNSGEKAREKLMSAGSSVGNAAINTGRFVRNPIASTKNMASAGVNKATSVGNNINAGIQSIPSRVQQGVGNVMQQTSVPIGATPISQEETLQGSVSQSGSSSVASIPSMRSSGGQTKLGGQKIQAQSLSRQNIKRAQVARMSGQQSLQTSFGSAVVHIPNQETTGSVVDQVDVATRQTQSVQSGSSTIQSQGGGTSTHLKGRNSQASQVQHQTIQRNQSVRHQTGGQSATSISSGNVSPSLSKEQVSQTVTDTVNVSTNKRQTVSHSQARVSSGGQSIKSPTMQSSNSQVNRVIDEKVNRSSTIKQSSTMTREDKGIDKKMKKDK